MGNQFTNMVESLMNSSGQDNHRGNSSSTQRIIYSAIVRDNTDYAGFNRLKAEIVSIDSDGIIKPGKDKDTPLAILPICIPLVPEFVHVRPQIGEAVLVICENPMDLTSPRFWIGPIITQQVDLKGQSYSTASEIFKLNTYSKSDTTSNSTTNNLSKAGVYYPQQNEIALQGRQDADITFSPTTVLIRAGRFKKGTTDLNVTSPGSIEMKQVYSPLVQTNNPTSFTSLVSGSLASAQPAFVQYSQTNIQTTNINLYSPEGKFRKSDNGSGDGVELNSRLKDFGDIASKLHPVAFGDELITLLKLILDYLATHRHSPQSPPLEDAAGIFKKLEEYRNGNKLQDLISNVVRIN